MHNTETQIGVNKNYTVINHFFPHINPKNLKRFQQNLHCLNHPALFNSKHRRPDWANLPNFVIDNSCLRKLRSDNLYFHTSDNLYFLTRLYHSVAT